MEPKIFLSFKQDEFENELGKLQVSNRIKIELNNQVSKNIKLLFDFLKKKRINNVVFYKKDVLDIVCYSIFVKYVNEYMQSQNNNKIDIKFYGFSDVEVHNFLSQKNYFNYCHKNKIKPQWEPQILNREKIKIENYKDFFKYDTFKKIVKLQEDTPFSTLNFPIEDGSERFIFWFPVYSEESKNELLNLINDLGIKNKQIQQLVIKNKTNNEVFEYGLGFVYKSNKLSRFTLYTKFDFNFVKSNRIVNFMLDRHKIKIKKDLKQVWYYGLDIYYVKNGFYEEIKIYDEPYIFEREISDKEVFEVLKNKSSTRVLKYRDGKIINEKFEFDLYKNFNKSEKKILEKYRLYNENSNVLAIYIANKKIIRSVLYSI